MKKKYFLLLFAAAVLAIAAALIALQPLSVQTEAALPGNQAEVKLPPCSGLEGRELDRCQVMKQERQHEYETGAEARGVDASSNTGRAARGSGVEGVSSANVTADPPAR